MLVNCVAYQEGKKLADIPKEAISDYLKRPGCFVWVALKDPPPAELEEMQEEFDLHGPRRRGRAARPPAPQDRGVRRFAVRGPAGGGDDAARNCT